MRKPLDKPTPRFGSIAIGETLPLREAARRLGWGSRMTAEAQRMGLRAILVGRAKITTGKWINDFIEKMAEKGETSNDVPN